MIYHQINKGATDQSVTIRILDNNDAKGTPETAVEHNTSGIDLWYRRDGATKTSITEAALASLDAAHSDGGIEHIGDGYYRLDLPDAAVASGVNKCVVGGTVTGMVVIGAMIDLVDAVTVSGGRVAADMTAVSGDTTAADTLELFAEALDQATGQLDNGSVADGFLTAAKLAADTITAAKVASDVTTEIQSGLATAAALTTVDSVVDAILAMLDDARGEPGQGAPPVNPDLATKIDYLYKAWRNRKTQTATLLTIYADNGTTADHKSTVSDNGTTFDAGEMVTGA